MKKLNLILAVSTLFLGSCSNSGSPKDTVTHFLDAVNKQDFAAAREYSTDETDKLIDLMEQLSKLSEASDSIAPADFEIVEEKISGDQATVAFREKGGQETETIHLVNIDGKWLVNISKQDLAAKDHDLKEEGESGFFGSPEDEDPEADTTAVSVNEQ